MLGETLGDAALLVDEFVFAPEAQKRITVPTGAVPRRRLIAGSLALLLVALGAGFVVLRGGEQARAQVYRYAFEVGEARTYDLQMTVDAKPTGIPDAQAFTGKLQGALALNVVEQREDGSAVVELKMSDLRFEPAVAGGTFDPGTLKLNVAPDGRISSVEGTGGILGAAGAAMQSGLTSPGSPTDTASNQFLYPQFPAEGVKPGDTWDESSKMTLPFGDESITMNVKGTHDGFEDTSFGEAARVKHSVSSPLNLTVPLSEISSDLQGGAMQITGNMTMDTTSLVLAAASDLVSMEGTIRSTLQMVSEGIPGASGQPLGLDATMGVKILRVA